MTVELKSLRITGEFDARSYVAGMDAKVSADRAGAASSKAVGAAVEDTKIKVAGSVSSVERLSRTYIDGYGTAARFNSEILKLAKSQDVQATSVAHLEQVYAGMQRRFGLQADASALQVRGYGELAKAIDNVNGRLAEQRRLQTSMPTHGVPGMSPLAPAGANDNSAQFRRQNAGYQYFDVAQSLSLGMNPAMIFAQQGPQLLQIYAGQGGVNAAIKDFTTIVGGAARAVGPLVAILAAGYGAYKLLESYSVEAGLAVSETTKALAAQAAPLGSLQGQIGELTSLQATYNQAVRDSANASSSATSIILDNTEREYNAKRSLLELEQRRLQASIEVQKSEIAIAQARLKADLSQQVNTRLDLERQGFADPRIGRFVALPDEITGLDKTRQLLDSNPLTDKIKELRANLELTEIGAQKLTEALGKTFDTKPYGTGDLPLIGPVPTERPNIEMDGLPGDVKRNEATGRSYRDVIESAQERIEQLKLEAQVSGQTGISAQRLRFELDLLNEAQAKGRTITPDQRKEIEALGAAYAGAAEQAARLKLQTDAQFEREQLGRSKLEQQIASQQRGAGLRVDMNSEEAGILRANDALREQIKIWDEVRDIGRSAIDDIVGSAVTGFEGFQDTIKGIADDLTKEFTKLALSNPLKNVLYGDNLPTLQTAGGVGGIFGALLGRSNPTGGGVTPGMSVTADTVQIDFAEGEIA